MARVSSASVFHFHACHVLVVSPTSSKAFFAVGGSAVFSGRWWPVILIALGAGRQRCVFLHE